ncbi:MAG TPA: hypothetical protein VK653_08320, partial [Xanthobacteraceae bacterium]|nr:hypothetical protein [Xanthobacteraceae bacterium]
MIPLFAGLVSAANKFILAQPRGNAGINANLRPPLRASDCSVSIISSLTIRRAKGQLRIERFYQQNPGRTRYKATYAGKLDSLAAVLGA